MLFTVLQTCRQGIITHYGLQRYKVFPECANFSIDYLLKTMKKAQKQTKRVAKNALQPAFVMIFVLLCVDDLDGLNAQLNATTRACMLINDG